MAKTISHMNAKLGMDSRGFTRGAQVSNEIIKMRLKAGVDVSI